jgi:hypothetical protein
MMDELRRALDSSVSDNSALVRQVEQAALSSRQTQVQVTRLQLKLSEEEQVRSGEARAEHVLLLPCCCCCWPPPARIAPGPGVVWAGSG